MRTVISALNEKMAANYKLQKVAKAKLILREARTKKASIADSLRAILAGGRIGSFTHQGIPNLASRLRDVAKGGRTGAYTAQGLDLAGLTSQEVNNLYKMHGMPTGFTGASDIAESALVGGPKIRISVPTGFTGAESALVGGPKIRTSVWNSGGPTKVGFTIPNAVLGAGRKAVGAAKGLGGGVAGAAKNLGDEVLSAGKGAVNAGKGAVGDAIGGMDQYIKDNPNLVAGLGAAGGAGVVLSAGSRASGENRTPRNVAATGALGAGGAALGAELLSPGSVGRGGSAVMSKAKSLLAALRGTAGSAVDLGAKTIRTFA